MQERNEFNQPVGAKVANWQSAIYPEKKTLRGKFCLIEPIDIEKHAKALYQALNIDTPPESWTYLPYGPFSHFDEFKNWLLQTNALNDNKLFAIIDIKTHQAIGICGYLRINPEHGSIEVGHLHYSPSLKRKPAATEAMYLMMKNAFENLGYRRYEWKCHSFNQPSIDAATRLGFKYEGTFRQSYIFKGRNRDTAWFSIIDSEWPELKHKLEAWLDPANFDSNGNQIKSLKEM